ncbi:molybdopterin-dependent oxidoreductase [Inmirania thermothiophila]|uniref:Anaerobic selenocysteine-containing dehydrogenase n=1 Tax=Inmirania thermothiophila TaxID=1750597 RepID=A0A3N1Y8M3_9GAMM|nr:molybdopterin-dependent oxidoreductase [Inmirania thermothiophila]ROR35125.1 anaerobic selenocysteine-containing dehydrogenase [Inmirania thermothiophila]
MSIRVEPAVCPHDCPSACALEVEVHPGGRIGRIRGSRRNPYTAGVICAKVARYAERLHHPDRLVQPLRRVGAKGEGRFVPVSWEAALDEVAERLAEAAARHGPETVWPYYYAGTMGLVQRDGINRLRHCLGWSGQETNICTGIGYPGWIAGAGALRGTDPRELAESELIVIWGCNAVATQVNVMTHVARARRRGARLVVVDPVRTPTAEKADLHLAPRPGTDGALACAVMHVLFRDGFADRDYLARYTRDAEALEAHLRHRGPAWAEPITGVPAAEIEAFARLYGATRRSFIRLGLGMSRQRNGAHNVHAVSCLPAVTGAWRHRGGGALLATSGVFHTDKTLIEGLDARRDGVRSLDMSRIGAVLAGEPEALAGGPPVTAMLIQNTNPAEVAPDSARVRAGLAREDLFLCVHEQFLTATARLADIVLPATMFLEHDDLYQSYGHTFLQLGRKVVEPPGACRSNHEVVCALAARLGAEHPGFGMSALELIAATLERSGYPPLAELERTRLHDCALPSERMRFLDGFAWPDGRFRFRPEWAALGPEGAAMPPLPDHWAVNEPADAAYPLRLVTPPARGFLNTTFTETPGSRTAEEAPRLQIRPDDAAACGIGDGDWVEVASRRGRIRLRARIREGLAPGTVCLEGIWPGAAFADGLGANALVAADRPAPRGGAAFHDTAVAVRPAPPPGGARLSRDGG